MNPLIASFYMENIPVEVRRKQRQVVDLFRGEIPFSQYFTQYDHARSIDYMLRDGLDYGGYDTLILLDIDAIPLHKRSFDTILEMTENATKISGVPQASNHLHAPYNEDLFVAPSVMCIPRSLWEEIGKPSAQPDRWNDVAQNISRKAGGGRVSMLDVYSYEKAPEPVMLPDGRVDAPPFWNLGKTGQRYGLNTTFHLGGQPLFFHSFQSWAPGQQSRFIEKCNETIKKQEVIA
jgi:hypothetical protein